MESSWRRISVTPAPLGQRMCSIRVLEVRHLKLKLSVDSVKSKPIPVYPVYLEMHSVVKLTIQHDAVVRPYRLLVIVRQFVAIAISELEELYSV